MNKKKLHEKDLARVVIYLTVPFEAYMDMPRKVRRKIMYRYKKYLVKKWKDLEQEAYDKGLFHVRGLDSYCDLSFTPTESGQKLINKYYPKYRQDIHG